MKNVSKEWWFLWSGLLALSLGLILRFVGDFKGSIMQFVEGLCIGLAIALMIGGLTKVRREARRDSGRA